MSPILVRPVREQLEHDRIIRLLQARLKRRHDVAINIGDEQGTPIRIGPGPMFPDLVLIAQNKGKRVEGIIEVETGESVNHLEAMAQWAHFGRARIPFHLYVPAAVVDIARRLCTENGVDVAELWSYHSIADQTRFTMVHRSAARRPEPVARERKTPPARKPARNTASARNAAPARRAAARPARKAARKTTPVKRTQKRK